MLSQLQQARPHFAHAQLEIRRQPLALAALAPCSHSGTEQAQLPHFEAGQDRRFPLVEIAAQLIFSA